MRRTLIEALERRKDGMIAALWANSNWDDKKNTRQTAIEEIESNYKDVIHMILTGQRPEEEKIDKENPFFQAAERGMEKIHAPRNDEGTVRDAVADYRDLEIDQ